MSARDQWRRTDLPPLSPLGSRDPNDHPNAEVKRCQIPRPHPAHPYGAAHAQGGLKQWCRGRE